MIPKRDSLSRSGNQVKGPPFLLFFCLQQQQQQQQSQLSQFRDQTEAAPFLNLKRLFQKAPERPAALDRGDGPEVRLDV